MSESDFEGVDTERMPAKPPSFGILLGLLAIGLTLTVIRGFAALVQLGVSTAAVDAAPKWLVVAELAMGGWALVNLVLLLSRRRGFIPSMIALLACNMGLTVAASGLVTVSSTNTNEAGYLLGVSVASLLIGSAWIVYLIRSQHVRAVYTR